MQSKLIIASVAGLALSALTVNAWEVAGTVACPNGNSAAGITVCIASLGLSTTTDSEGAYILELPDTPGTYKICADASTAGVGFVVNGNACQNFRVDNTSEDALVNFTLSGPHCGCTLPSACWLTGGGTIGKTQGVPPYSFGGVVYPGCSPFAAGGGNWNVRDHVNNLHFKGLDIVVDGCSGSPDAAPPVNVNIIDFHGTGIIVGIAGNTFPLTAVNFVGHAEDHGEPGAGVDVLGITATDANTGAVLLSFGPTTISTGNLQIHTSGCSKF